MKIRYLGHSCFELTSSNGVTVITDPYRGVGYELPKGLRADIVTLSHQHFDHNYADAIQTECVITSAGEHMKNGVEIYGIPSWHDEKQGALRGNNTIYKFTIDGVTLCHLGDIGEPLSDRLLQEIAKVDILFLPVGGTYTIDAVGAMAYVEALSPQTVIPMHYRPQDGSLDIAESDAFLALCKGKEVYSVPKGIFEWKPSDRGIIYMERVK